MKKVLFTATVDSHILQFHIPYLKWFKEQGYEVHVATNGTEKIPYCDIKHTISFERNPIKINNLKAIKELKKIIDKEKFEIIHCHTPMGSVVTRLAARKSRKNGTRVIYTAHGFHFYKGAPLINWLIYYPIEKWLSRYTDCLITINNEDYEIAKKKFKTKQIEFVHGVGVDSEKFNLRMTEKEKESLRQEIGISKADFVLIYPAELSKRKNQKMLIDVMNKLVKENAKFKLLLPGKDSMNGLYQKLVRKYNIEENIKFLGYRTDIPKLMEISNVAVSAAKQEGLPVNIMEAEICGLPCIVTNCRGNRDLVQDGHNGYIVEINDVDGMVDRIKKISDIKFDSSLLNSKFLLSETIKKMEKIYNKKINVCNFVCGLLGGGAEQVIYNYCSNMDKNKYDFTIVYQHIACEKNLKEFKNLNIKLLNITSKKKNIFKNIKETKIIIKNGNFDVIHAHMNYMNFIPLFYGKKYGVRKRISHAHTCELKNEKYIIRLFKNILKKLTVKYATELVACGACAGKFLYKNKEFSIIQNAIDISKFKYNKEKREALRNKLSLDKNTVIIGHVGRFTEAKNHEFLLEMQKKLCNTEKKYKLLIIGDGELKQKILNKINEYKLQDKVLIMDNVSNVEDYYQIMDIFVLPSKWEGVPLVGIEAQVAGLKCFVSNTITKEIAITDNITYLSINSVDEWVNYIKNLKEYDRNVKINDECFSIDKQIKKLEELYTN